VHYNNNKRVISDSTVFSEEFEAVVGGLLVPIMGITAVGDGYYFMARTLGSSRPLHSHSLVGLRRASHRPDPHGVIKGKPPGRRDGVLASSNGDSVISITVDSHDGFARARFPGAFCEVARVVSDESRVHATSGDS